MNHDVPPSLTRRYAIGASLVFFLIAVYFFTYYGYGISSDEWFLLDATESMARRGNLAQNFEFDAYPPRSASTLTPPSVDAEPLQPLLAAPLFRVAQALPGIGLAHSVWLFNIITTALTAGMLYAYGLIRGYRAQPSAVVAVLFGLGTIAWPYSRTFFREPLFTLCALSSAYLMARVRRQLDAGERPYGLAFAFTVAFAGALLSKEASLLLVPAIVAEAIPSRRVSRSTVLTLATLTLVALVTLLVMLNLDTLFGISITRWNLTQRIQDARGNLNDLSEGVRGYMVSPARSMWLFSPVLLIGYVAWPRLVRAGHWRDIAVSLSMTVSFVVGYALVRGSETWYGGLGWGPRYLVPVTPFVALWLLPVADSVLAPSTLRWKRIAFAGVVAFSVGVQILAVSVPIHAYYATLAAQSPRIIPWHEGAWSLRWSPFYVCLELLGDQPLDMAWRFAAGPAWVLPVLAAGLGALALAAQVWWARHHQTRTRSLPVTLLTLTLATIVTFYAGLYAIRRDPRYYGDFDRTHDLLHQLETHLQTGDVIVLNTSTYAEFFMNYYKRTEPTVYTLPFSPGERYSPEQPPKIESTNPEELIREGNTAFLHHLGQQHDRIWLVLETSPFIPWSVRPVEYFLARHYFPITELKATDTARAVAFGTTSAPPATGTTWPEQRTDAIFDNALSLVGYDIPGGTTLAPGDVLPVSLLWEARQTVLQDYTVALFVMDGDRLVAQRDSFPVNHFEFTATWQPGTMIRDNHGIALPDALPAGHYELWLAVYWWQEPNNRLPVTDDTGELLGDHVVLTTITVN